MAIRRELPGSSGNVEWFKGLITDPMAEIATLRDINDTAAITVVADEAARPTDPALNTVIIQEDNDTIYYWDGMEWVSVGGGTGNTSFDPIVEAELLVTNPENLVVNRTDGQVTGTTLTISGGTTVTSTLNRMGGSVQFVEFQGPRMVELGMMETNLPNRALFQTINRTGTTVTGVTWSFGLANLPFSLTITEGMGVITFMPMGENSEQFTVNNGIVNTGTFTVDANGIVMEAS